MARSKYKEIKDASPYFIFSFVLMILTFLFIIITKEEKMEISHTSLFKLIITISLLFSIFLFSIGESYDPTLDSEYTKLNHIKDGLDFLIDGDIRNYIETSHKYSIPNYDNLVLNLAKKKGIGLNILRKRIKASKILNRK